MSRIAVALFYVISDVIIPLLCSLSAFGCLPDDWIHVLHPFRSAFLSSIYLAYFVHIPVSSLVLLLWINLLSWPIVRSRIAIYVLYG
jgi:hypothetical protein